MGFSLGSLASAFGSVAGAVTDIAKFSEAESQFDASLGLSRDQLAFQQQLAKEGIRWRVQDAKKAGIHPLAALGMTPFSSSPVSTTPTAGMMSAESSFADAGNSIARAIKSKQTVQERLTDELLAAQVRGANIDNDIKQTKLASDKALLRAQLSPGLPSKPSHTGNVVPEKMSVMTDHGLMEIPSTEYGQVMENYWPETYRYMFRELARDYGKVRDKFLGYFR